MDIYREILSLQESQTPAALVTVIDCSGSTPRNVGTKMLVKSDETILGTIGGGAMEQQVIQDALEVISNRIAKRAKYKLSSDLGMYCGGAMEVFIEPIITKSNLIIFGAGHTGAALCRIGKFLDFQVTVVDERPKFANQKHLPDADKILAEFHKKAFEILTFSKNSYIIIVTHDNQYDEEILSDCAKQEWAYLGMIGSKRKAAKAFERLRAEGLKEEIIQKIHSPMGIQIGAQTPEEIAVAILAEIISIKYGVSASVPSMKWEGVAKKKKVKVQ
ncbi:MAG: xanthine dehydrogenase accessory protein XdhC [bacterium]